MHDLMGKVTIVTGAAGNLGRATAAALAARGARLALVDRDLAALERLQRTIEPGVETALFETNLFHPQDVAAMVEGAMARFGHIDALINIAGGFAMGPPLHETSDDEWSRMMDLNARTLFHCARATIPRLLANGVGRIVNISARAARPGIGHMAPYSASKAAVIALTESLADELKHQGINVNCILPGTVDTPENRAAMPDQDPDHWVSLDALADVILFLVSDASRGITGAAIPVYGRS